MKMTSDECITFLQEHFVPWLNDQRVNFRKTIIFMLDNTPSYAAHKNRDYHHTLGFGGLEKMAYPANSINFNRIENIPSLIM